MQGLPCGSQVGGVEGGGLWLEDPSDYQDMVRDYVEFVEEEGVGGGEVGDEEGWVGREEGILPVLLLFINVIASSLFWSFRFIPECGGYSEYEIDIAILDGLDIGFCYCGCLVLLSSVVFFLDELPEVSSRGDGG